MAAWLRSLQELWCKRIEEAKQAKEMQFSAEADILWEQYDTRFDDIAVWDYDQIHYPKLNKFREFVDLYHPFVLTNTPTRRVSVRRPQFPEEIFQQAVAASGMSYSDWDRQIRMALDTAALLLEWWLQFCSEQYDLLREARMAIIEALVKGRGLVWHGYLPTGTGIVPASFFESVDNLFIDPTAITLRDAGYIIRKRQVASWLLADQLGVDEEKLVEKCVKAEELSKFYLNHDIPVLTYYEVYSRIGVGTRLAYPDDELREWQDALDELGPYIWLAISPTAEYPLNLDPDLIQGNVERLRQAVAWPVATYGDVLHPWPCTVLDFAPNIGDPWARSPLASGYPIQQALNRIYYYIVEKAQRTARVLLVVPSYLDSKVIHALEDSTPFEVVPVDQKQIADVAQQVIQPLNLPPMTMELWTLLKEMEQQFAKAVGLDPILYGAQPDKQPRSAAEVQIRHQAASSRALAMAERIEDWMSRIAAKEGMITRLHVPFTQMAALFGEPVPMTAEGQPLPGGPLSAIWASQVTVTDPVQAGTNFHFQVVSGSGRRKDKQQQSQAAVFLAQTLLPSIVQAASKTGDYTNVNRVLERLANALDIDLTLFRFPTPAEMEGMQYGRQMDSESNSTSGRLTRESTTIGHERRAILPTETS